MNVPTMTIGKDQAVIDAEKQKQELEELRARCAAYEEKLRHVAEIEERAYMRGRIAGLEFSIRCNGVSGDEVVK